MESTTVSGRLLLDRNLVEGTLRIEGGRIAGIMRGGEQSGESLRASIVTPGFIDLQVNGGFGVEVGDDPDAFRHLASRLPATGVTAFLPTTVTSPPEFYPPVWRAFAEARGAPGARMLGVHVEGPLISLQRKGAHRPDVIAAADPALLDSLLQGDIMRIVTLAPERPGILQRIPDLVSAGVIVSLGHTDATYEQFEAGVDAGATMATHLFNGMSPFEHRAPGAAGAILTDDRVTAGLIADGIHTHPAALALAVRAKGSDRVVLVTDMMSAAGMSPGRYQLAGQTVVVDASSARLENGTLAGSILTMDVAVRNMVRWAGVSVAEALAMATAAPARLIGSELGRLVEGAPADLVLLDADLRVEATMVGGEIVYRREREGRS